MKTIITVEIETTNMNNLTENENGTGEKFTELIESNLHKAIELFFLRLEENDSEAFNLLSDYVVLDNDEVFVEGYRNLNEYGDIKVKCSNITRHEQIK